MAGVKGKTNNPNGRPPKNRALTDLLSACLNKTIDFNGKRVSGKRVLARLVSDILTSGRVKFPNDTEESVISIRDWLDFVKWAYERIDGKPVQPLSSDKDNPLTILVSLTGTDGES